MSQGFQPLPKGFSTRAIHAGHDPAQTDSYAVVPPLVLSATFKQIRPHVFKKYAYGRCNNPTREVLETCLASLEGVRYGICYSSGLGAISSMLGLFKAGDHLICGEDVYGGSYRIFSEIAPNYGFEVSIINTCIIGNVEKAIKPNTKLIFLETPSNPLLNISDIKTISLIAKKQNIIICVDNSFQTPYFQRPIELGADITMYSLTKYMNGHADVIMGALLTNNSQHHERLRYLQSSSGNIPSPFDCSQVIRSLNTLALRMRQHSHSALEIAKFLETHPKVDKVIHPGFKSHPQYELYKTQCSGHCGMISAYIKGTLEETERFLSHLKIFTLAGSLGGVQSLVALSQKMTHAQMSPEMCDRLGITENFVRFSIGLEDTEDLIEDIRQALIVI